MPKHIQLLLDKAAAKPQRLFLIDGLGALLTAFLLGVLLVYFEGYFGMPLKNLYFLSILACFYAGYSIGCYLLVPKNWRPFLTAIAVANLLYCLLTGWLVLSLFPSLTWLGVFYFLGEILVIACLIFLECWAVFGSSNVGNG